VHDLSSEKNNINGGNKNLAHEFGYVISQYALLEIAKYKFLN